MAALDLNLVSIIVFVLLTIVLLWRDRDNIERHAIVFVRRTKKGIGYLDSTARLSPTWWRRWANLGVIIGFGAMAFIVGTLIFQTLKVFFIADAVPAVTPILPTISSTTNPMEAGYLGIPFWQFMISISVVMIVHEMMHGVIARVEDFDIEYVGLILLGIIPGAFVQPKGQRDIFESKPDDPEEKQSPWDQGDWKARLRVLAAGPFANMTLAAILLLGFFAVVGTPNGTYEPRGFYEHNGIEVVNLTDDSAAEAAGMAPGMVITAVGGTETKTFNVFRSTIDQYSPGETVTLQTAGNGSYTVTLGTPPDRELNYKPAPVDRALAPLEQQVSGAIDAYSAVDRLFVSNPTEIQLARWNWVAQEYPSLNETAQDRIATLEADIPAPQDGYLGVMIVPAIEVNEAVAPFVDVVSLFLRLVLTVAIINLGIGMANLIPIKGLDGGWMLSILVERFAPEKEPVITKYTTYTLLVILLVSLLFVVLRALA